MPETVPPRRNNSPMGTRVAHLPRWLFQKGLDRRDPEGTRFSKGLLSAALGTVVFVMVAAILMGVYDLFAALAGLAVALVRFTTYKHHASTFGQQRTIDLVLPHLAWMMLVGAFGVAVLLAALAALDYSRAQGEYRPWYRRRGLVTTLPIPPLAIIAYALTPGGHGVTVAICVCWAWIMFGGRVLNLASDGWWLPRPEIPRAPRPLIADVAKFDRELARRRAQRRIRELTQTHFEDDGDK